jgi:hypothetical protein
LALTAVYRHQQTQIGMAGGQLISLPGHTVFDMPAFPGPEIDPYDIDTIQRVPIGTKLVDGEKVYRYVEFGGTTVGGGVVDSEVPAAAHDNLDGSGILQGASMNAGSKLLEIKGPGSGSDDVIANEYAGGQLLVEEDTGDGYSYDIEVHEALDISDSAARMLVQIKHGLAVTIDATSNLALLKSSYQEVIISPATVNVARPVGVSVGVGADGSFGWVQVRGPAAVLTEDTVVIGREVYPSDLNDTSAVSAALMTDGTPPTFLNPPIGTVMFVGDNEQFSLIYLLFE